MNILEVQDLCKTYGKGEAAVQALRHATFTVRKGEFIAIIGESGSGKSTLLNVVGALDKATSGKVWIDGQDIFSMPEKKLTVFRRQHIGFIFQSFNLIPELNVEQNITFPLLLDYKRPDQRFVNELLNVLGLTERRHHLPSQLSGGQQQRVAIGRALVTRPALILADEPTGNIDPALSYEIVDLLSAINERGTTVLMVTHEHSLVKHFHKRIIQIHSGEIVADTAAISKEQQAAAQAVATQETVAVDREAIRRAKEARAKADADAQPYATKEFTAPQNNDQANG